MILQHDLIESIRFASMAMAQNDVRYYLNGVCIRPTKTGMTIAGTNAAVCNIAELECAHKLTADTIIPAHMIPIILRALKCNAKDEKTVTLTRRFIKSGDCMIAFKPIDGKYPDLDRLTPKSEQPGVSQISLNAKYIALAGKSLRVMTARHGATMIDLWSPTQAVVISARLNTSFSQVVRAKCIVMPMRW
jgi:DNA polymerase III sliding clamp (beta) subunit (PCNA family)